MTTSIVILIGDKAVKKCRLYDTTNTTISRRRELEYLMEVSREKIRTEISIYRHLGRHDGIISLSLNSLLDADDNVLQPSFEMPLMSNGNLQEYLAKEKPDMLS